MFGYSKDCFLVFTDHLEVSTFETSSAAVFGSPVHPRPAAPFVSDDKHLLTMDNNLLGTALEITSSIKGGLHFVYLSTVT